MTEFISSLNSTVVNEKKEKRFDIRVELWQQRIYWAAFGAQAFSPKIYSPLLCSVYTVATVSACKASLMNKHGGQSQLFALTTTSNHMHIHEMASMQIILLRLQIITPPLLVCVCAHSNR